MVKMNLKASEIRSQLFNLIGEVTSLQLKAHNSTGPEQERDEAVAMLNKLGCELAAIHDKLPDLFVDAHRDTNDQTFGFEV